MFAGVPATTRQLSVPRLKDLAINVAGAPDRPAGVRLMVDGHHELHDDALLAARLRMRAWLDTLLSPAAAGVGAGMIGTVAGFAAMRAGTAALRGVTRFTGHAAVGRRD